MNELLPHQIQMIDMMKVKEQTFSTDNPEIKSHLGLCTNPYGSGKTICILKHIMNQKTIHRENSVIRTDIMQVVADGFITRQLIREFPFLDTTLVVANPMILFQWIDEIDKWKLDLKILILDRYKKIESKTPFSNYDIIFCYPNLYNHLMEISKKYYWKRFIYDEPFSAKIYSMKKIKVDYLWIICARPYELMNYYYRHHFIGFIFSNVNENKWIDSIMLSTLSDWKILNRYPIQLYESMNLSMCSLYSKISYMSIQYPYDNLESIFLSLDVHQTFDAQSFMNHIQNISHPPYMFQQHKPLYCTICLEPIHSDHGYVMSFCCYHLFCPNCFLQWLQLQKGCSVCRTVLTSELVLYIQSKLKEHKITTSRKTKEIILQDIIFQQYQKNPHLKMIIYASNSEIPLLQSILSFLSDRILFIQLDGNYVTKWKQLNNWKTMTHACILFITPSTFLVGLNMSEATDFILYNRNCDSKQQKILSLVQRLPDPNHCQIHMII